MSTSYVLEWTLVYRGSRPLYHPPNTASLLEVCGFITVYGESSDSLESLLMKTIRVQKFILETGVLTRIFLTEIRTNEWSSLLVVFCEEI